MAVPARISLITLGVTDVARATAFYESLGWTRSAHSGDGVSFFATADSVLALYAAADLARDLGGADPALPAFRGVMLAINVESEAEVDRVVDESKAAGATVPKPPEKTFWGGYAGFFADPDGHVWEVAHNPFFELAEDGSLRI